MAYTLGYHKFGFQECHLDSVLYRAPLIIRLEFISSENVQDHEKRQKGSEAY